MAEIRRDMDQAAAGGQRDITTLFFPSGNTMAMETADLAAICEHARKTFPRLERITVYGSSPYIDRKSAQELKTLARAGLSRIHVGLESGDDQVLQRVKKGTTAQQQARAGQKTLEAGLELSLYVLLGLGGTDLTREHALNTARVLNLIGKPDFVRLRTLVPKINTLLLHQIQKGRFRLLGAHGVLEETGLLLENLELETEITSDHYTNYLNLAGRLPRDKELLLAQVEAALSRPESDFRPIFIGDQ